mmetsp:Transcript_19364/g.48455  ORF Transcript_19364/g.48455 Transcript_19364/m.48455 type:complete len:113 (+) Transcript_19364:487-825(+)
MRLYAIPSAHCQLPCAHPRKKVFVDSSVPVGAGEDPDEGQAAQSLSGWLLYSGTAQQVVWQRRRRSSWWWIVYPCESPKNSTRRWHGSPFHELEQPTKRNGKSGSAYAGSSH